MWRVPYLDLGAQYRALKPELDDAITRVMASGRYINGEETERFERSMAAYLGVKHVIGVANGYDALWLSLKACGIGSGDQVVTRNYTHVSTHAAIHGVGATLATETSKFAPNAKAFIPVHMNGKIDVYANRQYQPWAIIEDSCQAIGAAYKGRKAGSFGNLGCFSCHPMKVLSCAGDGGFISTSDDALKTSLRDLRNHGNGRGYGVNSRLDNLQAAILNVKLPHLDEFIRRRRDIAAIYHAELPEQVKRPPPPSDGPYFDTYSSYVIGGSPEMLAHLRGDGIEAFSHIRTDCVSLPIYPEIPEGHIGIVLDSMRQFYG